jgi:hypothetical protein
MTRPRPEALRPDSSSRAAPRGCRRRRRPELRWPRVPRARASGFTDSDPTGTAALDPTRHQVRAAVRRATTLILRAEDEIVEVGSVIANGYLRLDREEWIRVVEKRSVALAPVAPRIAPRARVDGATGYHEPHQGGGVHNETMLEGIRWHPLQRARFG